MGSTINRTLAVFDLDGTLSRKDTMISFLFHCFGKGRVIGYFLVILPLLLLMLLRLIPIRPVKERVLIHFFKGMKEDDLKCTGKVYAERELPRLLYPKVYEALCEHQQQGHSLMLLTAGMDVWTEDWCKQHGMVFAGTRLEFIKGVCTGRIDGENCYGPRKKEVLEAYLKCNSFDTLIAYGNERADRYYMQMADQALMIRNGIIIPMNEKDL